MVAYADRCFFDSFEEVAEWRAKNVNLEVYLVTVDLDELGFEFKHGVDVNAAAKELSELLDMPITITSSIDQFLDDLAFRNLDEYDKFVEDFTVITDRYFQRFRDVDISVIFKSGTAEDNVKLLAELNIDDSLSSLEEIDKFIELIQGREEKFNWVKIDIDGMDFNLRDGFTKEEIEAVLSEFNMEPVILRDYSNPRVSNAFLPDNNIESITFDDVKEAKDAFEKLKSIVTKYFTRFDDLEVEVEFNE